MKSSKPKKPAPASRKTFSVLAKVVVLTSLLVALFVASQLASTLGLKEASGLISNQAQAVQDQQKTMIGQAEALAALKSARELADASRELRYHLMDLCLSQKTEAERNAQATAARIEKLISEVQRFEPSLAQAVKAWLSAYNKQMIAAGDAYADGNRVLGNSLTSEAQQNTIKVDEEMAKALVRIEAGTAAAGLKVEAAGKQLEKIGGSVLGKNRNIMTLCLGFLAAAILFGAGALIYLSKSVFRPFDGLIVSLRHAVAETASAASQISASSQALASGASEQAASIEETSASLEEMSSVTQQSAKNAQTAKELSGHTRTAAQAGVTEMQEMTVAMNEIKSSSDNIARIVKSIDEIAFQTTILSLNAAIEATRAGEAGLGFAVVAAEVRNLALRSAQAAKETAERIQDSIQKSANGVEISAKVGRRLEEIVQKVTKTDELIAELTTAAAEQSQGIAHISTAMSQMDNITQSNAASAEQSASAATEMDAQAAALKGTVGDLLKLVGSNAGLEGASKKIQVATKPRKADEKQGCVDAPRAISSSMRSERSVFEPIQPFGDS